MVETATRSTRSIPDGFLRSKRAFTEPCSGCKRGRATVVDGAGRGLCDRCAAAQGGQREAYRQIVRREEARRWIERAKARG